MDRLPPDAVAPLARAFALERLDARVEAGEAITLDELRSYLAEQVGHLLDRNPALLMSILYRVDVLERDVKETFATCSPPEMPERLADLLIERQLQKLALRRRYRDE